MGCIAYLILHDKISEMKTLIAISLAINLYTLIRLIKHERASNWSKPKKDWRATAWLIERTK